MKHDGCEAKACCLDHQRRYDSRGELEMVGQPWPLWNANMHCAAMVAGLAVK
jgi:hypothetical protein